MTPLSSTTAAAGAALSLTATAAFLVHLTTKEDGLGFSKVFVYGIYTMIALWKKPHFLKLLREEPMLDAVGQMIKYFGCVVAGHSQILVFAFALRNVDASKRDTTLGPAVLVFYIYLLLGAAFAVHSAFGILVRGDAKIRCRYKRGIRNNKPSPIHVKNKTVCWL